MSVEDAIGYHLAEIRRYGAGWRAPQVRRHREAVIALIQLRRFVRRQHASDGRVELGIGVWSDPDGTLHLNARAMCIGNGYEPTAENMARLEQAARDTFGAAGVPVDEVDER